MTAATLCRLRDTLQNRVRVLEGLGFKTENKPDAHMILIPLFEMKLPHGIGERREFQLTKFEDTGITTDAFFKGLIA